MEGLFSFHLQFQCELFGTVDGTQGISDLFWNGLIFAGI